jgi:hypothetical protein
MWAVSWINGELEPCLWKDHQQRILIVGELEHLKEKYEEATGWECVDPLTYFQEIEHGSLFVFVDHKVLCLNEVRPGFSKERILAEEFVGQGIDTETVVAVCRKVCATIGLKRFVVGTRAPANGRIAGLAKMYQRQGLSVSTIELMGEVHEQQKDPQGGGQV